MKIGIDVGGSHIGLGIVDKTGKLILKKEKEYQKTESNMSQIVLDTVKELIHQALNEKQITIKEIESKIIKKKGKKHEQFERNFRSRREQEVYRKW